MKKIKIENSPSQTLSDHNIIGLVDFHVNDVDVFSNYYVINASTTLKLSKLWSEHDNIGLLYNEKIEDYLSVTL
jgi:hypothetical protein